MELFRFVHWAYTHKDLRVKEEEVPDGILPDGVKARLADIKVFSKGPDDLVYDKNQELREKVRLTNLFLLAVQSGSAPH